MRERLRGRAGLAAGMVALLAFGVAATLRSAAQHSAGPAALPPVAKLSANDEESRGPAPGLAFRQTGGTLRLLQQDRFTSLDPQRVGSAQGRAIEQLLTRTLTGYRENGAGEVLLVGDLATGPGVDLNGDCRTWRYSLKLGVRFEDGREVTARDVAYGIARSFAAENSGGATYLQEWLAGTRDFRSVYAGPYDGDLAVPGLTVIDERTLEFSFDRPRCDLPYVLALPTTAPVPADRDTRGAYGGQVVSSGPFRIKEYVPGVRLLLVRNKQWDRFTDPVRHNWPYRIEVEFGVPAATQVERVLAGRGGDEYALAVDATPPQLLGEVADDPAMAERLLSNPALVGRYPGWPAVTMNYLSVNTARVTDVNVRRAIAFAVDKQGILDASGGAEVGRVSTTLLADTTIGALAYPDPYDGGPHGDPTRAREVRGAAPKELAFLVRDTPTERAVAEVVRASLARAGFRVALTYADPQRADQAIRTRGNPYDIYLTSWTPDWPNAAGVLPRQFSGRTLTDTGNTNVSYLDEGEIDVLMDQASRMRPGAAYNAWGALDQLLLEKYVPAVPLFQSRTVVLPGAKVGGVMVSDVWDTPVFYNTYALTLPVISGSPVPTPTASPSPAVPGPTRSGR